MTDQTCTHIRSVETVKHPKKRECGGLHQDRRLMGASADLPDVRRNAMLRLVAEPSRKQACSRDVSSRHRIR